LNLLEIHRLFKYFGGLTAIAGLDMHVRSGEILGLIGPNGAGKSTVLNMIAGSFFPKNGSIFFEAENITRYPGYLRARRGIARVFQRNLLFHTATVLDNVLAGVHLYSSHGLIEIFYRRASVLKREAAVRERAMDILRFVGLDKHADSMATNLPHGGQRTLCMAVALAVGPKLLLLDEPFTGMDAEETSEIMTLVKKLRDSRGITVIVVEHNMKAVLGLCDRAVVLNYGAKMAEGTPQEVIEDPEVIKAYLGAGHGA
jgi:branched-chain amino acid transport system ATP-binding protein